MRPPSVDQAIEVLRRAPGGPALVRDLYLDDPVDAAARFSKSGEWRAVLDLVHPSRGEAIVDVGAGGGMASAAFADIGCYVVAVEPDASPTVGTGRLRAALAGRRVDVVEAVGEVLPLRDSCIDVVYCRQVLHHARDLDVLIAECTRVLRPGGRFIACREHVVVGEAELGRFLAEHPVHRLAGGEHAFTTERYVGAITGAGLELRTHLGPWDSVVNAFPTVGSDAELADVERRVAAARFGRVGHVLAGVPGIRGLLRRWVTRAKPGELNTFLAVKP